MPKQISVTDAHQLQQQGAAYVDVRSQAEFEMGHPAGAIYGFEHYTKDAMFFQPGRRSPVKGLVFASGWTGDAGFQPTLEAGRNAAIAIMKDLGM